ncbi:tetratricopeptide repeat protein [Halobacterium salinarum]|uniref:tetratricopeptide repeat protein n=1 Tax=Halobacterium salinarum TaxID=2242 RepID=UPI002552382C|nr:tetratricopeptide repeat protein [Halobacterium salinarum]MDL0122396.1 tetratricopeptide repeat protein [Halobacterium salinarum]
MGKQHLLTIPATDETSIRVHVESKHRPHSGSTYTQFELVTTNPDAEFSSLAVSQPPHQEATLSIDPPRIPTGESVRFGVTGGCGLVRVAATCGGAQRTFTLPTAAFRDTCEKAISGDRSAASKVADQFTSPIQMANICGQLHTVSEIGQLLRNTVAAKPETGRALHTHRYDLIRGALTTDTGLTVETNGELEELVETLDSIRRIGSVKLIPALGDAIARCQRSPEQPKSLLEGLGYEFETITQQHRGILFVCHLAHLVRTGDIERAKSCVKTQDWGGTADYDQLKSDAEQADFAARGRKWRAVLPKSAHRNQAEFSHVLANALHWTGVNVESHSRVSEPLFDGAVHAAVDAGNRHIEGWARYERLTAKGHRLRAQNNYRPAERLFRRSERIASNYGFLPQWEPIYNTANVRASILRSTDDYDAAIETLESALDDVVEYTIPKEKLNEIVHHLKAQELETRSQIATFGDEGPTPETLLEEAETHYQAIGFERSASRVQHKRGRLDPPTQHQEMGETASPTDTEAADANTEPAQSQPTQSDPASSSESPATESTPSEPIPDATDAERIRAETQRDQFEPNPELDDSLSPTDPSQSGTGDIMTSPRDRDNPRRPSGYPDDEW